MSKWPQILRSFRKLKDNQILKVTALYVIWNPEICRDPPTCGQDDLVLLIKKKLNLVPPHGKANLKINFKKEKGTDQTKFLSRFARSKWWGNHRVSHEELLLEKMGLSFEKDIIFLNYKLSFWIINYLLEIEIFSKKKYIYISYENLIITYLNHLSKKVRKTSLY